MNPAASTPHSPAVIPADSEYRFWTEEKLRNADTDQQGHAQADGGAGRAACLLLASMA